jgi:hypothetical protein
VKSPEFNSRSTRIGTTTGTGTGTGTETETETETGTANSKQPTPITQVASLLVLLQTQSPNPRRRARHYSGLTLVLRLRPFRPETSRFETAREEEEDISNFHRHISSCPATSLLRLSPHSHQLSLKPSCSQPNTFVPRCHPSLSSIRNLSEKKPIATPIFITGLSDSVAQRNTRSS